jgi:hypothetical protein
MSSRSKRRTPHRPPPVDEDVDGNALKVTAHADRDERWWLAESEGDLCDRLLSMVTRLRDRQRPRREMYRFYAELYGVHELAGLGLTNYDPQGLGFVAPTLPFNVVRRGVKTVLAKVAKNRPMPMVVSERGNYRQWKRARGLSNFLDGAFSLLRTFDKTKVLLRDALIFGTGIGHVYHLPGDTLPRFDRIFPWEILTDVADARYGDPRQIFLIRWVDRTVLKELYPKHAAAIEGSTSDSGLLEDIGDTEDSDVVLVTEAWRLPTRAGGVAGRHAICIDGVTLFEEPWTKPHFPLVMIRYDDPVIGAWGDSLAGEMAGFQYEVNYVAETLRMAHRVVATGIWITDDNTGIPDAYFQNEVGMIIKKRPGTTLTYENPEPANPQTYQWLQTCAEGSLAWNGISQLSANAQKPAGITAAKAITAIQDVEDDGFSLLERGWEQLHVDVADRYIDEFKELAAEDPDLKIFATQKRALLQVKWSEVDMERDAIVMQVWPTNLLGRTPAARMQTVNDLYNQGIIDSDRYLQLLDAPDIDAETDLRVARRMRCDEQIDAMLELDVKDLDRPGAYKRPGPYQDLAYGRFRAQDQICMGELRGIADPVLDLLRRYIEDCTAELKKLEPPPPPPQLALAPNAPPGMGPARPAPGGMPGMPPGPPGPPGAGPPPGPPGAPPPGP